MTKDKIINKIAGLMKLARDANDEEGQASIALAQKLMLKHDIQMSEIDAVNDETNVTEAEMSFGRVLWWQRELAAVIAHYFKCRSLYNQYSITFVGLGEHSEIARKVYEGASDHIKYRRSQIKDSKEAKNSYVEGFILGLHQKLKSQTNDMVDSGECTDLVVCTPIEVTNWLDQQGFKTAGKPPQMPSDVDFTSLLHGYDEGMNAEIMKSNLVEERND